MSQLERTSAKSSPGVVETLSHFMRTNYGAVAEQEALRHVVAYNDNNQRELASIWLSIAEVLRNERLEIAGHGERGERL
jgi:hypothetical protein